MPPFITAIKTGLNTFAGWLLFLVPAILILTFIIGGIALSKAEDPHDIKVIKGRMQNVVIGAAIAGGGTWLGNWLWGLF